MNSDEGHDAALSDGVIDDLIVRHLDGGLDPAGQRRLAGLLAGSADARRTLATYLRLEGGSLRLARAGLLGGASVDPTVAAPAAHPKRASLAPAPHVVPLAVSGQRPPWPLATWPTGRKTEVFAGRQAHPAAADVLHGLPAQRHRSRWPWPASLALAAVLLVVGVLWQLPPRGGAPAPSEADLDRLADNRLTLAHDADATDPLTADTVSATDAAGQDGALSEPPEGIAAPPDWLITALADDAPAFAVPDEG